MYIVNKVILLALQKNPKFELDLHQDFKFCEHGTSAVRGKIYVRY